MTTTYKITSEECQDRINRVTDTITIFDYVNTHKSGLHCSVCNQSWVGNPSAIYRGTRKCPICTNQKIVVGYNDLWHTRPDVARLLKNPEDGYKYSFGSGKRVIFVCPECGAQSNPLQIWLVAKYGLSCHNCSDGISIPNKFMSNLLRCFLGDSYEREKVFDWCKFSINGCMTYGIYDFYFKLKDKRFIVEMDGGLGHGKEFQYTKINEIRDKEAELERDHQKDLLAQQHGIQVIRIDAQKSDLNYLCSQVKQSALSEIFDFDNVDFCDIYKKCLTSLMMQVIRRYNSGITSTKTLSQMFKISIQTVITYLKRGAASNLCAYDPSSSEQNVNLRKKLCKPVICKTDNKVFASMTEAARYYKVNDGRISENCRHLRDFVWIRHSDRKLVFEFAS